MGVGGVMTDRAKRHLDPQKVAEIDERIKYFLEPFTAPPEPLDTFLLVNDIWQAVKAADRQIPRGGEV